MALFFGKFSSNYPAQYQQGFYRTNRHKMFGDLEIGDYVFVVGGGKVQFWQAERWEEEGSDKTMWFKIIFDSLPLNTNSLTAIKLFKQTKTLVVLSVRQGSKAFYPIELVDGVDFGQLMNRSFYDNKNHYLKIHYTNKVEENLDKEGDLVVVNDGTELILYNQNQLDADNAFKTFRDNTDKISGGRKNKDKTLRKFKNATLPIDFDFNDVSLLSFYDAFCVDYGAIEVEENNDMVYEFSEEETQELITIDKPLNKILYGPPGTGKTYSTINHALTLLGISCDNLEREEVKKLFKDQLDKGRIVFTTFHQSMSYEEFVEGIKPIAPKTEGEEMYYDIEDGVFKQLASKAELNQNLSQIESDSPSLNNAKLFDGAFQLLKEKINTALVTNEVIEEKDNYRRGFVIDLQNSFFSITAISGSSIKMMTRTGNEKNSMTRDTLREIYNDPDRLDEIITGGMATYYRALVNEMISWNQEIKQEAKKTELQSYVLIIDEINRGNVSAIFGELITLLEPDKRLGQPEELRLTLPYSKTEFGVPSNLHIIGTMNTADRSVEALDTALRRRFEFEEVMPRPELLSPSAMYCRLLWKYSDVDWEETKFKEVESSFFKFYDFTEDEAFKKSKKSTWARMESESQPNKLDYFKDVNWGGIDLQKILETINERIELLVDRDHTIGHSYLMNLTGMEDLVAAFRDKIVPLLQEYFYGDYGKIGLVLGNGFVQRDDNSTKEFSSFKYENKKDFVTDSYSLKKITVDNIKQALEDLLETDRKLQAKRKAIQEISTEE